MKGKIFKIKNTEDELVLPITTTEAVYSEDGKTLNDELDNIENEKATRQEVDVERKRIDNISSSLEHMDTKSGWYVNIKSFLKDGETDISNALKIAIESLKGDGGTIILPCDKTYTISKTITITKNNVVLKGDSQYYNTSINVTCDVGLKILAHGFECECIRFIGNGVEEGGVDATNIAIEVGNGTYEHYDNFLFKNSQCYKFGTGLNIKTRNFIVENSTFSWCLNGIEVEGLTFTGAVQGDRRNYRIADNRFHVCWGTALKLTGTVAHSEVFISNNQFDRCMDNIIGYCEESLISNNLITITRGKGIYIDNTNKACGHLGVVIANNVITSWVGSEKNNGDGIYIKAENSSIRANKISRKNGNGIQVIGNNNEITSNNITDSSFFDSGVYSGILVSGNFNLINNNISKNVKGTTQKYGLEITSNSQGCFMMGNILGGATGQTNQMPPTTQGNTYEGMTRGLRFGAGIPNNTEGQRGDYVINKIPTELGENGSRYIVHGWQKVQDYTGGTSWIEVRILTGR